MRTAHQTGKAPATGAALDVGRGLAILAVIYGHALAPWFVDAGAHSSHWAFLQWKFGAAFMMPFFFFVSGLAWRSEKSLWATLRESLTLIFTAIGASVALDLVLLALSAGGLTPLIGRPPLTIEGLGANLLRMVAAGDFYSLSALWFLTVLALVRLIAAGASRLGPWAGLLAGASLFGFYLAVDAFGGRNFYQIAILWAGFIAFIAGRASRGLFDALERQPAPAMIIAAAAFVLTAGTAGFNRGCEFEFSRWCNLSFLNDRFGVSMFMGAFGYLPLFVFTAATGIVFTAALSILITRHGGAVAGVLKRWGRNSLNLLIVNAAFLELVNPSVWRYIAPRVGGDDPIFFAALFSVAVLANIAAAGLLRPALARLRLGARDVATFIVDVLRGRISLQRPRARAPQE